MGCILRNSQDGFEGTRWAPFDPVINGGTWGPSKWSKINGFHWGYIFHPSYRSYNPSYSW